MMGIYLDLPRPLCCGCNRMAVGRVCYVGNNDKIVDNPYCAQHFGEVFKQTSTLVRVAHQHKVESEHLLVQNWRPGELLPKMPKTLAEIILKGQKIGEKD